MRRNILILACAGLWLAACSDDNTSLVYDIGADLAAGKDKGPPQGDGPATQKDGPAVKPDGPVAKPDLPASTADAGPGTCAAMDVTGVGACKMILGHYWDGSACQVLSGCSCAGTDCKKLYPNSSACQTAHAHCAVKAKCSAWDAKGVGMCSMLLGYIWDGKACQGISGCSCGGADCKFIYSSPTACAAGQAHCP